MRLRFIIGFVADFAELGIDTTGCRLSIPAFDAEGVIIEDSKALVHQENLTDEQFDSVISAIGEGKPFIQRSNDNADFMTMLGTEIWSGSVRGMEIS